MKKKIKKLPSLSYKFINSPDKLDKAFDTLFEEMFKKDMKKLTNQERFDILRGNYDGKGFHSMGREGVDMDNLLKQMGFKDWIDFWIWYKSLTLDEIKAGKKNWCSGKCCHSILSKLLEMEKIKRMDKIKKLVLQMAKEVNEPEDEEKQPMKEEN